MFDGVLIGCGVMVVATLGFGVLLVTSLEFSTLVSTVCDCVLLGCGVMVLVCPWFPSPNDVGIAARIAMSFLF